MKNNQTISNTSYKFLINSNESFIYILWQIEWKYIHKGFWGQLNITSFSSLKSYKPN